MKSGEIIYTILCFCLKFNKTEGKIISRIGLSPIWSIGFGHSEVWGKSLFPSPPAIITTVFPRLFSSKNFSLVIISITTPSLFRTGTWFKFNFIF